MRKFNTEAWWKFTIERLGGVINRTGITDSKILSKFEFLNATLPSEATNNLIADGLRSDRWTVRVTKDPLGFKIEAKRGRTIKGVNMMVKQIIWDATMNREENPSEYRTHWLKVGEEAIKHAENLKERIDAKGYGRVSASIGDALITARGEVKYLREHGLDDGFDEKDISNLVNLVNANTAMLESIEAGVE